MRMFERRWWVPANSRNEKAVPELLSKWGLNYRKSVVIDTDTGKTVGYVYQFGCIPGKYYAAKKIVEGGNSFHPLEVVLME